LCAPTRIPLKVAHVSATQKAKTKNKTKTKKKNKTNIFQGAGAFRPPLPRRKIIETPLKAAPEKV
jgi:hypothetical protein